VLTLAQAPGTLSSRLATREVSLINGFTHNATNSLGDLDMWSFYGTPGDSNVLVVTTVNFVPRFSFMDQTAPW
jgi:hypothetical protein